MTMRNSIAAARISDPTVDADGTTVCEFQFRADDAVFVGHFPGRPLLPGVFQLEMLRAAMAWVLKCPLSISEIRRAKFLRPILPAEIVRMELKWTEDGQAIHLRGFFFVTDKQAGETAMTLRRDV